VPSGITDDFQINSNFGWKAAALHYQSFTLVNKVVGGMKTSTSTEHRTPESHINLLQITLTYDVSRATLFTGHSITLYAVGAAPMLRSNFA